MYTYSDIIFPFNIPQNTRFFVLMGFSLNGPVNTPFMIRDGVDPYSVLGDCRLAENYLVAKKNGISPLIIRLNGSHGEITLVHEEKNAPFLSFKTIEAKDECNQISIRTFPTHIIIEGLYDKKTYYLKDYVNTADLANAIKRDMYFNSGEVEVEVVTNFSLEKAFLKETQYYLSGADDGYNYVLNHNGTDSDEKIQSSLDLLEEKILDIDHSDDSYFYASELDIYQIDTLLFTDIPYEKAPVRLIEILGKFAESKTNDQCIHCSVVLCSNLFANEREPIWNGEEYIDNYIEQISKLIECSSYNIYGENIGKGEWVQYPQEDLMLFDRFLKHIEVVVGIHENVDAAKESMPCAASFAAMRYNLLYYDSATNKPLVGVNALYSNHLLKDEVANLSANGYTLCVPSKVNGIVPYSSKSLLPHFNSFQAKPHYMRSVCFDVYKITRLFDKHIGQPTTLTWFNSAAEQIKELLKNIKEAPIYRDISVEFLEITRESIRFAITFEMYGEIEAIKTSFEYTPSNEVNVVWN